MKQKIAGMSLKGGRKDDFFFCLLEHFEDSGRLFLSSILHVQEGEGADGNDTIRKWASDEEITQLVVDFPLSRPPCDGCELECPGAHQCNDEGVVHINKIITSLLAEDNTKYSDNPKQYEYDRVNSNEFDYSRDFFEKEAKDHLLTKAFKRKLKKGFVPYWNRSIDLLLWAKYYDQMLELFNTSYESMGSTSLMILQRFSYLKRHIPEGLSVLEGNTQICLIELIRLNILTKADVFIEGEFDQKKEARRKILSKIETELKVFFYQHDLEILIEFPNAFQSFLLALLGHNSYLNLDKQIPSWANPDLHRFILPDFSSYKT